VFRSRDKIELHLKAGAGRVLLSVPSKSADDVDATVVLGVNDKEITAKTKSVSNASCTTNCLAPLAKALHEAFGIEKGLMVTVHGYTNDQNVCDQIHSDLRRARAAAQNIIPTTTGAAKALGLVIPEMENIGFIAESVRIPTSTGSLIVLVVNIQDEPGNPTKRTFINSIYRDYAASNPYLKYSENQNVSSDIIGVPEAAAIIEGTETHTRTASIRVNLARTGVAELSGEADSILEVPVTQAVIYGWYDNELGSYTNMLGDLTVKVAETMV